MQTIPLYVLRYCLILATISILFRYLFYWHWLNCFNDSEIYLKHTFKCIKWDLHVDVGMQHNKVHILWGILWYHVQKSDASTSLSSSNECLLCWKCWMFWDNMHCISLNFKLFTNKLQRLCKQHLKDSTKKLPDWVKINKRCGKHYLYIALLAVSSFVIAPACSVILVHVSECLSKLVACEHQPLASDRERYDCLPGDGWGG